MGNQLAVFVKLVEDSRDMQRRYFKAAAKARKTNFPDDFQERIKVLELSKLKEKEVDAWIANYRSQQADQNQPELFEEN